MTIMMGHFGIDFAARSSNRTYCGEQPRWHNAHELKSPGTRPKRRLIRRPLSEQKTRKKSQFLLRFACSRHGHRDSTPPHWGGQGDLPFRFAGSRHRATVGVAEIRMCEVRVMILRRSRSGISEEVQAELGPRLGHDWATAGPRQQENLSTRLARKNGLAMRRVDTPPASRPAACEVSGGESAGDLQRRDTLVGQNAADAIELVGVGEVDRDLSLALGRLANFDLGAQLVA